jgi:Amt family ammonium transporter
MICAFMVFFFQCGFAMVETGFCRGKNAAHTMTMNFMVFLVGAIGYFLVGFALQMGGSGGAAGLGAGGAALDSMIKIPGLGGIMGFKGFMLNGTYDAGIYALFFFQMVFMDTTVTIPTGAMAERVKYSAVVITSFFISMVLYIRCLQTGSGAAAGWQPSAQTSVLVTALWTSPAAAWFTPWAVCLLWLAQSSSARASQV